MHRHVAFPVSRFRVGCRGAPCRGPPRKDLPPNAPVYLDTKKSRALSVVAHAGTTNRFVVHFSRFSDRQTDLSFMRADQHACGPSTISDSAAKRNRAGRWPLAACASSISRIQPSRPPREMRAIRVAAAAEASRGGEQPSATIMMSVMRFVAHRISEAACRPIWKYEAVMCFSRPRQ